MPLIQPYEEKELFNKLIKYFEKIHHDVSFTRSEEVYDVRKMGSIYYTFPGEQEIVMEDDIVIQIKKAMRLGYNTPIIILRKGGKDLLLDGHRRLRAAWDLGVPWPALIMSPSAEKKFGIEDHIQGQVKDIWKKSK